MIVPVILAGGSGSRLWPLSRSLHPKQFIDLVNKKTLFQDTILRLPEDTTDPLIICNEEHRFLAAEQLRQISKKSSGIILEPVGKILRLLLLLQLLNSVIILTKSFLFYPRIILSKIFKPFINQLKLLKLMLSKGN